jgi:hypothetical protein
VDFNTKLNKTLNGRNLTSKLLICYHWIWTLNWEILLIQCPVYVKLNSLFLWYSSFVLLRINFMFRLLRVNWYQNISFPCSNSCCLILFFIYWLAKSTTVPFPFTLQTVFLYVFVLLNTRLYNYVKVHIILLLWQNFGVHIFMAAITKEVLCPICWMHGEHYLLSCNAAKDSQLWAIALGSIIFLLMRW